MNDVMIDIETLSTAPDAVVLSIGAAGFNENGLTGQYLYLVLDLDSQFRTRRVDQDTFLWWMRQSKEAQDAVFCEDRVSVEHAFEALSHGFTANKVEQVWARGPHFDIAILDHLRGQFAMPSPWKYNKVRDSRTILDGLPKEWEPKFVGTPHHALDDARHEAAAVVAAIQYRKMMDGLAQTLIDRAAREAIEEPRAPLSPEQLAADLRETDPERLREFIAGFTDGEPVKQLDLFQPTTSKPSLTGAEAAGFTGKFYQ